MTSRKQSGLRFASHRCIPAVIAAFVLVLSDGCVTQNTILLAKPQTTMNEKHEEVETRPARPGYYALLPLAVAADIALIPGYLFAFAIFGAYGGKN
jgi:hypothetical protein